MPTVSPGPAAPFRPPAWALGLALALAAAVVATLLWFRTPADDLASGDSASGRPPSAPASTPAPGATSAASARPGASPTPEAILDAVAHTRSEAAAGGRPRDPTRTSTPDPTASPEDALRSDSMKLTNALLGDCLRAETRRDLSPWKGTLTMDLTVTRRADGVGVVEHVVFRDADPPLDPATTACMSEGLHAFEYPSGLGMGRRTFPITLRSD